MIPVEEALARIFNSLPTTETETVPIHLAYGRVLSRRLEAARDQPPFDASAMDGYAVKKSDVKPNAKFEIIGEVSAGEKYAGHVGIGQAVRIFTGAPLPAGCNHVVIQEDVERSGSSLQLRSDIEQDSFVRPAGGDFRAGAAIESPRRISPIDAALLASMNYAEIPVFRRPVVALLSTGNELAMPGEEAPSRIIASNPFALKGIFENAGAEIRMLPIARDNEASLSAAIALAEDSDLVISIGGASVGKYDLVRQVAESLGIELLFHGVAMRPGKPLMAGILNNAMLLAFPGNPVSSIVCAHIFGVPVLAAMQGLGASSRIRKSGRLITPLGPNGPREHYMRGLVKNECNPPGLRVFERQDSSLLSVMAAANSLVVRPPFDAAQYENAEVEFIDLQNG